MTGDDPGYDITPDPGPLKATSNPTLGHSSFPNPNMSQSENATGTGVHDSAVGRAVQPDTSGDSTGRPAAPHPYVTLPPSLLPPQEHLRRDSTAYLRAYIHHTAQLRSQQVNVLSADGVSRALRSAPA